MTERDRVGQRGVRARLRAQLRRLRADDGSAALEFLGGGLLLLVPLVYLAFTVAAVQGGALAAEGAARQAARVWVQSTDTADARAAVTAAVAVGLSDFGLDPGDATVEIECDGDCLASGAVVTVRVATTVPLPLVPGFLRDAVPLVVPVSAEATQRVSRFARIDG